MTLSNMEPAFNLLFHLPHGFVVRQGFPILIFTEPAIRRIQLERENYPTWFPL